MKYAPTKAVRKKCKASIVIEGMPGTGKSGLALMFAKALAKSWDKIVVADTEHKSVDLFEGLTLSTGDKVESFDKFDCDEVLPSDFLEMRQWAKDNGKEAFIIDSSSHCWAGKDGILDKVTQLTEANSKVNNFNAWGKPEIANEKNNIVNIWRDPDIHCITTVRVKEKFKMDDQGVHSVGEQQIMQVDQKYEPDLGLTMVRPGNAEEPPIVKVFKSRYACFRLNQEYAVDQSLLDIFCMYLDEGKSPEELDAVMAEGLRVSITDILNTDKAKQLRFKMFKKSVALPDETKLADMNLQTLQAAYKYIAI